LTISPDLLKDFLSKPLPGWKLQKEMSPINADGYINVPDNFKPSAVMILVFPVEGKDHVVFMKRTSKYPQDKHAGQISFPGGALDDTDGSLAACAQRETFEEVGINPQDYTLLAPLTQLYVYVSNFMIYPYVGWTDKELQFVKEDEEVDKIIMFPIENLLNPATKKIIDLPIRNTILKNVPYFDLDGEILWGATSMILNEFLNIYRRAYNSI